MVNPLQEAVQFFKSERAYQKLFCLFRKKYESLGRVGGTVSIADFTKNELESLGEFFGLPGEQLSAKGTIALRSFEEQMEHTRFSSISLKPLLDAYFGENIRSKKEQREAKEMKLREFLYTLEERHPNIAFWISHLKSQNREGRWILRLAENSLESFSELIAILNRAFGSLPLKAERLPIFGQRITGDPHAFDLQTDLGRLFIHLLAVHQSKKGHDPYVFIPSSTEEINELLERYFIYRDDLLNFVTCANLVAETTEGIHPVWKAAADKYTVQIVPLRELIPLVCIKPISGNKVWIVENSGVCATLLDHKQNVPIVCTNGQFTLAALMLMDLLAKNGCMLYYAGDFDPEGLGMAQRLVDRYSGSVRLWHMNLAAYIQSKPTRTLTEERLVKLDRLTNEQLIEVANEMRETEKAGYQEAVLEWMLEDVVN